MSSYNQRKTPTDKVKGPRGVPAYQLTGTVDTDSTYISLGDQDDQDAFQENEEQTKPGTAPAWGAKEDTSSTTTGSTDFPPLHNTVSWSQYDDEEEGVQTSRGSNAYVPSSKPEWRQPANTYGGSNYSSNRGSYPERSSRDSPKYGRSFQGNVNTDERHSRYDQPKENAFKWGGKTFQGSGSSSPNRPRMEERKPEREWKREPEPEPVHVETIEEIEEDRKLSAEALERKKVELAESERAESERKQAAIREKLAELDRKSAEKERIKREEEEAKRKALFEKAEQERRKREEEEAKRQAEKAEAERRKYASLADELDFGDGPKESEADKSDNWRRTKPIEPSDNPVPQRGGYHFARGGHTHHYENNAYHNNAYKQSRGPQGFTNRGGFSPVTTPHMSPSTSRDDIFSPADEYIPSANIDALVQSTSEESQVPKTWNPADANAQLTPYYAPKPHFKKPFNPNYQNYGDGGHKPYNNRQYGEGGYKPHYNQNYNQSYNAEGYNKPYNKYNGGYTPHHKPYNAEGSEGGYKPHYNKYNTEGGEGGYKPHYNKYNTEGGEGGYKPHYNKYNTEGSQGGYKPYNKYNTEGGQGHNPRYNHDGGEGGYKPHHKPYNTEGGEGGYKPHHKPEETESNPQEGGFKPQETQKPDQKIRKFSSLRSEQSPSQETESKEPTSQQGKPQEGRKHEGKPYEGRKHEGKPYEGRKHEGKSYEGRKQHEDKPQEGRKQHEGKPYEGRKNEGKPYEGRKNEGKPYEGRKHEDKETRKTQDKSHEKPHQDKPQQERKETGPRKFEKKKPEEGDSDKPKKFQFNMNKSQAAEGVVSFGKKDTKPESESKPHNGEAKKAPKAKHTGGEYKKREEGESTKPAPKKESAKRTGGGGTTTYRVKGKNDE